MDASTVAIGGVVLIPVIVGLIQLFKRFAPNAPDNVWLALSFVFGVAGQFIVYVIANGGAFSSIPGWDLATWAAAVVTGLAFGLAASKAYDEVKASEKLPGRVVRAIANK